MATVATLARFERRPPPRPAHAHPRRHRRRHRLCRPGAGAHSRAPSGGHADGRDVVGRHERAAAAAGARRIWDGTVTPLDVDRLAADGRRRVPGAARGRVGRARAEAARARRPRHRSLGRVPDPRRRRSAALVSGHGGAARRHGLRHDRAAIRRRSGRAAGLEPRAAIRRRRCSRSSRWPRPACSKAASWSTRSRASRAPARRPTDRTHFSENHGSVAAYGIFSHRHTAEIEQELGMPVTFVPHLVPLDRGILETIYASLQAGHDRGAGGRRAAGRVRRRAVRAPHRRRRCRRSSTWRTPTSATSAGRWTRRAAASCSSSVLDNLVKGAAGSAVQNLNVLLGLDERTGLLVTRRRRRRPRLVLKLGGELLEQPQDVAADRARHRARWPRRRRSSSCTAAARRSTPRWRTAGIPKRQVDGLRVTDAATLDVVVAVLAGVDQHAPRRGGAAGGRRAGRPDRRRRRRGRGETRGADHVSVAGRAGRSRPGRHAGRRTATRRCWSI